MTPLPNKGTKSACSPRPARKRGPQLEPMLKQSLNFYLKNKIFGILESLLYQNLYKTKNFPYLTNLKYTWDLFLEKEWLRIKSMYGPNTFSNNILNEPQ
jgi:hypothetical protein